MNISKNKDLKKLNNFISSNKSPQPTNKLRPNIQPYEINSFPNPQRPFQVQDNLDENININDYLNHKQINFYQNKNKNKGRSPENLNRIQNNYYNYNKYYNSNTNYYPNIAKHFESDDMDDKNINYKNNKDEYNKSINLKKKILEIREQNSEEYNQYINKNYGSNNIYNYNNYYNGNYYNNTYNQSGTINPKNQKKPQVIKVNQENRTFKYDNYDNYRNYNKNKSNNRGVNPNINNNKIHHKYSQDRVNNNYLSDNNFKRNPKKQTQKNIYKTNYQNFSHNNDSSSSNIYDDSYDYKTQYNFKKNPKKQVWDLAKFYSASSQENSYSEDNNHNTSPIKPPLKNDEKHYHQNLTIKIKNPEEQQKPPVKYVDNTPEGCIVPGNDNLDKKNRKVKLNITEENIPRRDYVDKNMKYLGNKTNIEFPKFNKGNNDLNKNNKKIKEITVDLSPKKKLNLSNSNQSLGRRINKMHNFTTSNFNINPNQNPKIESCIITFDKNKNKNNNVKYKLNNSSDRVPNNTIRYVKKKVIVNTRKNFNNLNETPGFNINDNYASYFQGEKKVYQKPGGSRSLGKSVDNLEMSGEVKDYCAPSPDYGKKGKEAYLNEQKKLNNNSPLLSSSGKYQLFESDKKDKKSPLKNRKFDEFSFRENKNDINTNLTKEEDKSKETSLSKLVIKSFSNKQKEIKQKPNLIYNFYKKYYDIYIQLPLKNEAYITKQILNKALEQDYNNSYGQISKKYLNNKLINAPMRGKFFDISAQNFFIKNDLKLFRNDDSFKQNNTIDIELEENNNESTPSKINIVTGNKFIIRTVIKKIKKKKKDNISRINTSNIKTNINIESLIKEEPKTKEQIKKEKKVNSILKEDLENYVIYYKENINNSKNKKYDWSTVELLMIKIKLDIGDIIKGYLKSCEEIITEDEHVLIGNDYINNIIHHYKNNYLTNSNFEEIHNKIIKIFLYIKDIQIECEFKFRILWGLVNILINNELFFVSDFDILKQGEESNKNDIRQILEYCDDVKFKEKINF